MLRLFSEKLSDGNKLDLLPVIEDLKTMVGDLGNSQAFNIALHETVEGVRREIPQWSSRRKQIAAEAEAVFASYGRGY